MRCRAESNVAVALARLGKRSAWMSRLPDGPLGQLVANAIRAHSVDVNYRALLRSPEDAARALKPFCRLADVVFVAQRDALNLFRTEDLVQLREDWGATVIQSRGADGAVGWDGAGVVQAPSFPVAIIDRLGAGDTFVADIICRLLEDASLEAALKLMVPGDFALITRPGVEQLLSQGGSGAIHR